jgi:membrane protein
MFKFLPDARVRWGDVWLGAGITADSSRRASSSSGSTSARAAWPASTAPPGSLVVFLVWVYYSAQILFIGAEFTRVWAEHHGACVRRTMDAKRVVRRKAELSQTRS